MEGLCFFTFGLYLKRYPKWLVPDFVSAIFCSDGQSGCQRFYSAWLTKGLTKAIRSVCISGALSCCWLLSWDFKRLSFPMLLGKLTTSMVRICGMISMTSCRSIPIMSTSRLAFLQTRRFSDAFVLMQFAEQTLKMGSYHAYHDAVVHPHDFPDQSPSMAWLCDFSAFLAIVVWHGRAQDVPVWKAAEDAGQDQPVCSGGTRPVCGSFEPCPWGIFRKSASLMKMKSCGESKLSL